MHEGDTEFWKRRFLGEGFNGNHVKPVDMETSELPDELDEDEDDDDDDVEDVAKEVEDEEADEEGEVEVEVEQTESQDAERIVKAKEAEAKKPLQMIGVQLLKDSDQTTRMSKKSRRRAARLAVAVRESVRFAAFFISFPFLTFFSFFFHVMQFIKLIVL